MNPAISKSLSILFFLYSFILIATENPLGNYEHYFRENKAVIFHYTHGAGASARLEFFGELPEDLLIEENKDCFTEICRFATDGSPYRVFFVEKILASTPTSPSFCSYCESPQMKWAEDRKTLLPSQLTFAGGRMVPLENSPEEISISQCKALLHDQKCVFLIGTALAEEAGVLSRGHFAEKIGLEKTKRVDAFVEHFLKDPDAILQEYIERTEKGLFGEPTPTIKSLANLAVRLQAPIFTCNFDHLLQKTEAQVINVLGGKTKEITSILESAEVVLTVGLRRDPEQVLAYFKSVNPEGKIIAINLERPTYLGEEDFLLPLDLKLAIEELSL